MNEQAPPSADEMVKRAARLVEQHRFEMLEENWQSGEEPAGGAGTKEQSEDSGRVLGTLRSASTASAPEKVPTAQPPAGRRPGVNRSLTRRRRRPATENDEFAAFARRVIRAWARRVASGDIDAVADIAAAASELDHAMRDAVAGLRAKGYSWAEIAARLGVTRQAAHQRWGGKSSPGA